MVTKKQFLREMKDPVRSSILKDAAKIRKALKKKGCKLTQVRFLKREEGEARKITFKVILPVELWMPDVWTKVSIDNIGIYISLIEEEVITCFSSEMLMFDTAYTNMTEDNSITFTAWIKG